GTDQVLRTGPMPLKTATAVPISACRRARVGGEREAGGGPLLTDQRPRHARVPASAFRACSPFFSTDSYSEPSRPAVEVRTRDRSSQGSVDSYRPGSSGR